MQPTKVIFRIYLLASLLISSLFAFGQMNQEETAREKPLMIKSGEKMEAYFGMPDRNDASSDILELYDGGYMVTGGFKIDEGVYTGWNLKLDKNLELLYEKELEHDLSTVSISSFTTDDHGNIYITGFTTYPGVWPFIVKLDSCGNKSWCKILTFEDEVDFGGGQDIVVTNDNTIAILSNLATNYQGIEEIHIIYLNDEGEVLMKKQYATLENHPWIWDPVGKDLIEHNNELYISGRCYWPYPNDTTHLFLRPFFVGIDSLFEEKWILPFYAMDSIFGYAFQSIAINDTLIMGIGTYFPSIQAHGILMYYNTDGSEYQYYELPNSQIGPDIYDVSLRCVESVNDTLFVMGALFGPNPGGNPGGELLVSSTGKIIGFNSRPNTSIPNLTKTNDGHFVFSNNIQESKGDQDIYVYKIDENLNDVPFDPTPHTYDSLCPDIIQSGSIDLTDCFVWTDVSEAPSPAEYFSFIATIPVTVYPNPANSNITFSLQNTQHHKEIELRCFNLLGEEVFATLIIPGQLEAATSVTHWPKGMYVGVMYSEGWVVGECKFVVE